MNIDGWTALIIAVTSLLSSGVSVFITKLFEARALMSRAKAEELKIALEAQVGALQADVAGDLQREAAANATFADLAVQCKQRVDELDNKLREREGELEELRKTNNERLELLQVNLEELRGELLTVRATNRHLCHVVRVLINQLVRANITPEILPDSSLVDIDSPLLTTPRPVTKKWGSL